MQPRIGLCILALLPLLSACAGLLPPSSSPAPRHVDVVRSDEYVIVLAQPGDTWHSLAHQFLGDPAHYWRIADFNDLKELVPGQEVVIPLKPRNPLGVYADGYQMVPILAYHRFGPQKSHLTVTPEAFDAQMAYLKAHDYRVMPLTALLAFLQGRTPVPRRAVVITLDDGYKSAYTMAYPILQKYGFPATVFIYSDLIGTSTGLSWQDMRAMVASHLIDIQPHSKTHTTLGPKQPTEPHAAYAQRVESEIHFPAQQIQQHLNLPVHTFAYPYGETNDWVIARLQAHRYHMGVTVQRGGNPFFADPFLLRRTMIYGHHTLEDFIHKLDVFQKEKLL